MSAVLSRRQVAELCECRETEIPAAPAYNLGLFHPSGPVGRAYIQSQGPIDFIMGPFGSGKTINSFFKALHFTTAIVPPCLDGRIRARGVILHANYRVLYRTVLRSWFNFFPPSFDKSEFSGGQDRPAQHVLKLTAIRAGVAMPLDLTVDFFALGSQNLEEALKGFEPTWALLSEADLLPARAAPLLYGRLGRYPPRTMLDWPADKAVPAMVGGDMNPPDLDHPVLQACQRGSFNDQLPVDDDGKVAPEHRTVNFFQQPSGLAPDAENRIGRSRAQYEAQAATMPEEDVRRFVHGLPGWAIDGRPIYGKDFDQRRHVARETLRVLPGLPLHIGFDQGLSPGAVLFQMATTGQCRVLAELVPDQGTGPSRFLSMLVPLLLSRFRDLPPGIYGSDPSGFYGADRIGGEMTWAEAVGVGLGHPLSPADTNEPTLRIEAVKLLLGQSIDAQTPALIIDPSCRKLIAGFAAHYKFRRVRRDGKDSFENTPMKPNWPYDAVHDALQYGVLAVRGRAGVIGDAARAGRPGSVYVEPRGRDHGRDFDVWSV